MSYKTYEVRIYDSGNEYWYLNDQRHREDGPAIEFANGNKYWYLDGNPLTEEEFNQRNQSTLEGKAIEIEGKRYKLVGV